MEPEMIRALPSRSPGRIREPGVSVQYQFGIAQNLSGMAAKSDEKDKNPLRSGDLELRQLRYFVTVAGTLSFGKASRMLHVSQPPLSRQIQSLEKSIGVTLFNRSNGGVTLTPAGSVFLLEAEKILQHTEEAVKLTKRAQNGELGKIDVGCSRYLDLALHDFLNEHLKSHFPGLEVCFHSCSSAEQARLIRQGGLDAGIVRLPLPEFDHLTLETLCREPIVAMIASDHPLSTRCRLSIRELADRPVAMLRRSAPATHDRIYRLCMQENLKAEILEPGMSFSNLVDSVRVNKRVALVPSAVSHAQLRGMSFIPFQESYASSAIGILYRRNDHSGPLLQLLETTRKMPMDLLDIDRNGCSHSNEGHHS